MPENTFTDADSDTLTYSATQSDGSALPSWLTFDAPGPGFSGLPQAADVETVSVKVTASDGNGGSVSDTFDIVVSADTTTSVSGVLVSNVGQTSENVQGFGDTDFAQSFTTGTNPTGYTLTSIELKLSGSPGDATATPTVKLFSVSATGTEVATFTGPAMLDDNRHRKLYVHAVYNRQSSCLNHLLGRRPRARLRVWTWLNTASTSEDATPAAGWLIGDRFETRPASSTGGFTLVACN